MSNGSSNSGSGSNGQSKDISNKNSTTENDDGLVSILYFEYFRFITFKSYKGNGCSKLLSVDGFYYDGLDVKCAYCDVKKNDWEIYHDVNSIHKQISPNCPVIKDPNSRHNIKFTENTLDVGKMIDNLIIHKSVSSELIIKNIIMGNGQLIHRSGVEDKKLEGASGNSKDKNIVPKNNLSAGASAGENQYTVQVGDVEHCFVQIGIRKETKPEEVEVFSKYIDVNILIEKSKKIRLPKLLMLQPGFAFFDDRYRSFVESSYCPSLLRDRAAEFAACGFYYLGYDDKCVCYSCNYRLSEWCPDDIVVFEHCKANISCFYLNQLCDVEYLGQVKKYNDEYKQSIRMENERKEKEIIERENERKRIAEEEKKLKILEEKENHFINFNTETYDALAGDNIFQIDTILSMMKLYASEHDYKIVHVSPTELIEWYFDKIERDKNSDGKVNTAEITVKKEKTPEEIAKEEERIKKLKEENKELKKSVLCIVCLENYIGRTFRPCMHFVTCSVCSEKLRKCPVCRANITSLF